MGDQRGKMGKLQIAFVHSAFSPDAGITAVWLPLTDNRHVHDNVTVRPMVQHILLASIADHKRMRSMAILKKYLQKVRLIMIYREFSP